MNSGQAQSRRCRFGQAGRAELMLPATVAIGHGLRPV